jgi:hypothetical protein
VAALWVKALIQRDFATFPKISEDFIADSLLLAGDSRCFAFYERVWKGNDMNAKRLGKLLAFAGIAMCLGAGLADRGLADDDEGIKPGVPNGTYAFRDTGYVPTGPSGPVVPLAAAGHITFFVDGTTSGVLTGSINGQITPVTVHGTWTVNPDGSVSETEIQTGGPGLTLHFKDYFTLDGNTGYFVEADPGSIVSGIDTR